jgi:uncharacterized membrane protein
VAAVLPGVAIAISLVPPLAVVGVCAGQGSFGLATGALLLFLSNILAMVMAGTLVYTTLGYSGETAAAKGVSRRKAYITISVLFVLVAVPLLSNTAATYLLSIWTTRVEATADEWIASVPGASIDNVDVVSNTVYIQVQTPGDIPSAQDLVTSLEGQIPSGVPVVITTSVGQEIEAGTVGQ